MEMMMMAQLLALHFKSSQQHSSRSILKSKQCTNTSKCNCRTVCLANNQGAKKRTNQSGFNCLLTEMMFCLHRVHSRPLAVRLLHSGVSLLKITRWVCASRWTQIVATDGTLGTAVGRIKLPSFAKFLVRTICQLNSTLIYRVPWKLPSPPHY